MFKAVWFLSVLVVLVNLLYVYAALPPEVVIQEEVAGQTHASKELLFYLVTAALVVINVLVYFTRNLFERNEDFRAWFHGLIITINIFFVFAMSFVQLYNSAERYDYSRLQAIIYGSVGLMVLWAVSWPLYSIFRKIFPKHAVS